MKTVHANFNSAVIGDGRNLYAARQQLTGDFAANIFLVRFNGERFVCCQPAFVVVKLKVFGKERSVGYCITNIIRMKKYAVHANNSIIQ